ncbi:TetR/AcrR family transcriptional regulator [Ligilactobacillus sp. WILCCON 0076]|uniref:TetR/AcrR family transcriptional regulator n=1 Tax=Ligilactobacillus ubinensis TaxID=2876789 RepID=A0A9X2JL70_9LACO|nr:TetR/AcrR family transcriptional regulator [Ligilactobacillus ubinensis]MCP0886589.1 TetR/AcrR family transcriptional regulator [Ligilactobacillus ubinensis]
MQENKIIQAFLTLIKNNDYEQISITQIMQEAHLTRTYFYQFFDSKNDLAREAFFLIVADILDSLSTSFIDKTKINDLSTLKGVELFLTHSSEMKLLLSFQAKNFNFVAEFKERIKKIIKQQVLLKSSAPTYKIDYFSELFAVSALTTISWALKQEQISAEIIVDLIDNCVSNGLLSIIQ